MTKQDSAFYTNCEGAETVWDYDLNERFYVVRNGEMRIHAKRNPEDTHTEVIRYTDQLEEFGISDDTALVDWSSRGEEVFDWVNNSWFEVWDSKDGDYFSDPFHELSEAIEYAKSLSRTYGRDGLVE